MDFNFLDFHTHWPSKRAGVLAIEAIHFDEKKHLTETISPRSSIFSVGIHPCFLPKNEEAALRWLRFEASLPNCLAVGEAGLDKNAAASFQTQGEFFMAVARVAEEVEKPLIIHSVKSDAEILAFKKALKPRQTWILHGFTGHPNQAKSLIINGLCLSFGHAILKNENAGAALAACPDDRYFLETDDEKGLFIEDIYQAAARIRGEDLSAIQWQQRINFEVHFSNAAGDF